MEVNKPWPLYPRWSARGFVGRWTNLDGRLVPSHAACSTVTADWRSKTPLQCSCLLQASCPMRCNLWTWRLDDCCCCYCRWRRLPQVVRGRRRAERSCLVSAYTEKFFLSVIYCCLNDFCLFVTKTMRYVNVLRIINVERKVFTAFSASRLIFWRRNYFFLISAHPVYKMWIIQEPNTLELWNKLHFEERKTVSIHHF